MQCILCEKFSAAKNYANALGGYHGAFNGKEYQIVNSVGHIFRFLQPEDQVSACLKDKYKSWNLDNLPWNYNDLKFEKVLNPETKEIYQKIKDAALICDEIVIATDNDPTGEGTLLAIEILEAIKNTKATYYRSFHIDESPKEIKKAMYNLVKIGSYNDLFKFDDYLKSNFRSKWDYLSMQWTRVFTKLGDGSSVLRQGRLKSYMVWAVGEQIRLFEDYKKIPYYQNRFKDENGNIYVSKNEEMYPNINDVPKGIYKNSEVVLDGKDVKHKAPPALYDLSLLSATLAPKGFTSKQVLETYQSMYEAHILSYPRTEDKTITPEQFNDFLEIADDVARVVGVDTKLLTHRTPRSTHVKASGSHGANRPASVVPESLDKLEKEYGLCGSLIYQFVARNSLAILCEDYEYIHQTGHVKLYPDFVGSVNLPLKLGYKQIFNDEKTEDVKELGKMAEPFIYEGFPPKPAWPTAKWLANVLKKNDVGTGATRTSIYADVTDEKGKYPLLIDTKGHITMTEYGDMSYKLLKNTHIGDVKLTENLQNQMKDVANGAEPDIYYDEISRFITEDIKVVKDNAKLLNKVSGATSNTSLICPVCGNKIAKYNWGYSCLGYKNSSCNFSIGYTAFNGKLSDNEIIELIKNKQLAKIKTFKTKEGKMYKASLKIDENGKLTPVFHKLKAKASDTTGTTKRTNSFKKVPFAKKSCPKCGAPVIVTDKGLMCSKRNKGCDFGVWSVVASKKLNASELEMLLEGKEIGPFDDFVSKAGNNFSASIYLDNENKVALKW